MDKNELWRMYCSVGALQQGMVRELLYLGRYGENETQIMDRDTFMTSRMRWPDDETAKRITRVIQSAKRWFIPMTDLYIIGQATYRLGVIDGKRLERRRKK